MSRNSGRNRKNRRTIHNKYVGMAATLGVVLLLFGILVYKSYNLNERLTMYHLRAETLEKEIENQKERTEEIDQLRAYMATDEYAEAAAREKLGLVKDNEIVFREQTSDN